MKPRSERVEDIRSEIVDEYGHWPCVRNLA